jgi:hypothetical protein
MDQLKYDVASVYCAPRGQTFYFIRNNVHGFFESKGMDLSSLVYMLLFKVRDFRSDHRAYVRLLQQGNFDLRNKPYYNEDELIHLAETCVEDEFYLFKKREHEIDLSLLDEEDELRCMAYVAQFNPRRNYYNGYSSHASDSRAFVNVLMRDANFTKVIEKMMATLERDINIGNPEPTSVKDLVDMEDLKDMITGPNGDLWVEIFLMMELPEREKYRLLYQAQPREILKNKEHCLDVEFVRCAIDGVKCSHKKLKAFFAELPREIQEHPAVLQFYDWHRECSL